MVQPKMVYLSQPTELGTMYTKQEMEEIRSDEEKVKIGFVVLSVLL